MIKEKIDKFCEDILIVLLVHGKKIRFTKLYEKLTDEMKYKISRPTLSEHLKHLQKRKYVKRRREGIQNVTYRFNEEYFTSLSETIETQKRLTKLFQDKKERFNSLPIDQQIISITANMVLRNLRQLKLEILIGLDPSKEFENKLEIMFINDLTHRYYDRWLLKNCLKDKEYSDKVLKKIDLTISEGMKDLLEN